MEAVLKGKALHAIAHKSHTATVVATSLALRSRLRHESDIARTKNALIRDGEKIVDSDYIQFWRDIQAAGAGVLVIGRKGMQDRFIWHYSLKKVAEGMLNSTDVKVSRDDLKNEPQDADKNPKTFQNPIPKIELKAVPKAEVVPAVPLVTPSKQVFIPLREGFDLELKVPANLSKSEVDTIIRALGRVAV